MRAGPSALVVIDASAAYLALLNRGEARSRLASEELHAPHSIDAELMQSLRRADRFRIASGESLETMIEAWQELGVQRHSIAYLLRRIWRLRHNLAAHDAAYVALAEMLGCPLITADRRLAKTPLLRTEVVTISS